MHVGMPFWWRTDKRNLTLDEHYQFVAAVEKRTAEGRKVADVADDLRIGTDMYASLKQLK